MSKQKPVPPGLSPSDPVHPLAERVRARVAEASLALDQRARASRPKARRTRSPQVAPLQAAVPLTPAQMRDANSLRRVFNEMAVVHRQFRLRSGQHASPALRDAARAFKETPNLPSLVVVATFLEEEGLLAW